MSTAYTGNSESVSGRILLIGVSVLLVGALGGSIYTFSNVAERDADDRESLTHVRDARIDSQRVAGIAREATLGNAQAYGALRSISNAVSSSIEHLGGAAGALMVEGEEGRTVHGAGEAAPMPAHDDHAGEAAADSHGDEHAAEMPAGAHGDEQAAEMPAGAHGDEHAAEMPAGAHGDEHAAADTHGDEHAADTHADEHAAADGHADDGHGDAAGDDHHGGEVHEKRFVDEALLAHLDEASRGWSEVQAQVGLIMANRADTLGAFRLFDELETVHLPLIQAGLDDAVQALVNHGGSGAQVALASSQQVEVERLIRSLNQLIRAIDSGVAERSRQAEQIVAKSLSIRQAIQTLLDGDSDIKSVRADGAREGLQSALGHAGHLGMLLEQLDQLLPALFSSQQAAVGLVSLMEGMDHHIVALEEAVKGLKESRLLTTEVGYMMTAVSMLLLVLLVAISIRRARARHEATVREKTAADELNARNQEAILTLLDEMGFLADGDLSRHATVTEDITGAIADSVNYAIDALRSLVVTINATSARVSESARETMTTTQSLTVATEQQAEQITSASTQIDEMAQQMEAVSREALNSAEVAQKSVELAHKGGEVVRSSIDGMGVIREQIQETSKRIKRLGESSQEIGAIVELINDIADQTNILALNAAIQAAMAGEAGRGFAVVADEVQRLAERSTDATKQIGALINTIQADTNEAVTSMERSTANVVSGAQLATDAGGALEEIESVSLRLSDLIQGISKTALSEAESASNISARMGEIREITRQTTDGTRLTSESIGKLVALAEELGESVAGFTLPEGDDA